MAQEVRFTDRVLKVLKPTDVQVAVVLIVSVGIIVAAHSRTLLSKVGITQSAITATSTQFHDRFNALLKSSVAGQLALVTFWALVGLVAYVVCWASYNLLIELRNEMTIDTTYTNRGGISHGAGVGLVVKICAAAGLGAVVWSLRPGASLWVAMAAPALTNPTPSAVLAALVGIFCFAIQLYALIVFIQLTFTPWYRAQTFTDA